MDVWVIARSEDSTEWLLTGVENVERQPKLMIDTEGQPLVEVKRFDAETYEEAKRVLHREQFGDDE